MEKTTQHKRMVQGLNTVKDECLWMHTGIIDFRECDHDFDCNTCPFDQAMQAMLHFEKREATANQPGWAKSLKNRYPGAYRPCRHVLTGRVGEPKICTGNYECYHCPFDQALDQEDSSLETNGPKESHGIGLAAHPGQV